MARNKDRDIVECALRIRDKIISGGYYTLNGRFHPKVMKEIERMIKHCHDKVDQSETTNG